MAEESDPHAKASQRERLPVQIRTLERSAEATRQQVRGSAESQRRQLVASETRPLRTSRSDGSGATAATVIAFSSAPRSSGLAGLLNTPKAGASFAGDVGKVANIRATISGAAMPARKAVNGVGSCPEAPKGAVTPLPMNSLKITAVAITGRSDCLPHGHRHRRCRPVGRMEAESVRASATPLPSSPHNMACHPVMRPESTGASSQSKPVGSLSSLPQRMTLKSNCANCPTSYRNFQFRC